jgi:hypothetical protein
LRGQRCDSLDTHSCHYRRRGQSARNAKVGWNSRSRCSYPHRSCAGDFPAGRVRPSSRGVNWDVGRRQAERLCPTKRWIARLPRHESNPAFSNVGQIDLRRMGAPRASEPICESNPMLWLFVATSLFAINCHSLFSTMLAARFNCPGCKDDQKVRRRRTPAPTLSNESDAPLGFFFWYHTSAPAMKPGTTV